MTTLAPAFPYLPSFWSPQEPSSPYSCKCHTVNPNLPGVEVEHAIKAEWQLLGEERPHQ